MATTTNYGWTTPDDTALVKDGAAAIRTLGSSVDTTVKALSPGTTAGDIDYYTAATTKARVGIGANGTVLTSDGSVPSWVAPSSGGMTLLSTTTLSGASTTISSISQDYINLYIVASNVYSAASQSLYLRFNGNDTAANYNTAYTLANGTSLSSAGDELNGYIGATGTGNAFDELTSFQINIPRYSSTENRKLYSILRTKITSQRTYTVNMNYSSTTAISSIKFASDSTFTAGTVYLYGVK
jgi:hypothetical protein